MAKWNNNSSERYSATHTFELETAKTLGGFTEQLRQHTEQICGINQSFSAMNLGFAKMEIDIHEIKEKMVTGHKIVIEWKTIGKVLLPTLVGLMTFAYYLKAFLGL